MAWPPAIYPPTRINDTLSDTNHPGDHNQLSEAVTEIVNRVNTHTHAAPTWASITGKPTTFAPATHTHAYLPTAGGTVTGALTVNGLTTINDHINVVGNVTTHYVNSTGPVECGPAGGGFTTYGTRLSENGTVRAVTNGGITNVMLHRAGTAGNVGSNFINFFRGVPWSTEVNCGSVTIASASSVVYDTTSDGRLKERIADVPEALGMVVELGSKVYRGRWKNDECGQEQIFVNAQDVLAVMPQIVNGDPEGDVAVNPLQMDHSRLVPLLLAAVSQLTNRLTALEAA